MKIDNAGSNAQRRDLDTRLQGEPSKLPTTATINRMTQGVGSILLETLDRVTAMSRGVGMRRTMTWDEFARNVVCR